MSRSRLAAAFIASTLIAATALADAVTAQRTLDVVVTDKTGKHIPSLGSSDFQILEDGKPVSIQKFTEMTSADSQPPRRFLFVIDEASISLGARRIMADSIRSFVQTRVAVRRNTSAPG